MQMKFFNYNLHLVTDIHLTHLRFDFTSSCMQVLFISFQFAHNLFDVMSYNVES